MQQEEVILGARALGDQVYKIMPTYQIMMNQVEETRKTAKLIKECDKDIRKQGYNNTIGIFGPRGAGKSSVLYTLRNDLDKNSNILFPLIEPDNFGENTKIIGSIVGFLKKEGEDLLKELKKGDLKDEQRKHLVDYYNAGVYIPNNKLKQVINETIEYHLYTENHYRNILTQHYEDLAVYVNNSSRVLSPDIAFKNKFNELIDEIIRVKGALDIPGKPILIFIFIDDIDLKTSKTRELMEALLQYMDHPNIVTVLSGDYDILLESLTLALLADEPLSVIGLNAYDSLKALDRRHLNSVEEEDKLLTIMRRKAELAHEYLKKIIPSAKRHQLVKWNTETIPFFSFGQNNLVDLMAQLMGKQSAFCYENLKKTNINNVNFLPIKNSYVIFDERPRGLVYAYYNLVQLLNDIEIRKEDLFRPVKAFIDTLILSNTNLLKHQEWLFEHFLKWGSEANSTHIDYSVCNKDKEIIEDGLDLQIFIIAEIVKKLLPYVRYDVSEFHMFKARLFENSIRGKKEKELNFNPYGHRLYHLIRGIVKYTDVPAAMLLIEYLSMSANNSYYYEHIWSDGRREKDQFIVLRLAHLVSHYPSIFEILYYKAQNENNDEINKALNILHDLCNVPSKFEVTEHVYEEVLHKIFFPNDERPLSDKDIKRTLFINNLTKIREEQQEELTERNRNSQVAGHVVVVAKDENRNLANVLFHINEKLSENIAYEIPRSVSQTIEVNINKFCGYIHKKLNELSFEVHIGITEQVGQTFIEFRNGYSGESQTTKYFKCKNDVLKNLNFTKKESSIAFNEYIDILKSLNALASNSRAWYGRRESRNLFYALQYSSCIARYDSNNTLDKSDLFFTGNDALILSLYYQYCTSTQKFSEEQEYESAKAIIRAKLDNAFKNIQVQTEIELREVGLNLEGAEE